MAVDRDTVLRYIPDSFKIRLIRADLLEEYIRDMIASNVSKRKLDQLIYNYSNNQEKIESNIIDSLFLQRSFLWSCSGYKRWGDFNTHIELHGGDKFTK